MGVRVGLRTSVVAAMLFAVLWIAAWGQQPVELGPAPRLTQPYPTISKVPQIVRAAVPIINTGNRSQVVSYFNAVYRPSLAVDAQWTGNIGTCSPGTTSLAYLDATIQMVNYFRAMTGLPGDVGLNSTWNSQCQEAALMMIANRSLSHFPPTTWACYTANGAAAAGKSNLAIGADGPRAMTLYVDDPGGGNQAVGHRRWILYPPQQTMGTGSTTGQNDSFRGSNALWVLGVFGTRPATPEWVAWPPQGYVPYQIVYPRWSFSRNGADFTNATITMTYQGGSVALTKLPIDTGYGDNTVVWEPSGIPTTAPSQDLTYTVQISNVLESGSPYQYVYDVTIIDPDRVVQTSVGRKIWMGYE